MLTATLVVLTAVLVIAALLLAVAAAQARSRRRTVGGSMSAPAAGLGAGSAHGLGSGSGSASSGGSGPAAATGSGYAGPEFGSAARPTPALGSPAQVWLERGEKVAQRVRALSAGNAALSGVGDDAGEVLTELRDAAADVATLDAARARMPVTTLQAERQRLDHAVAHASGQPAEADLRAARDAVDGRLALAAQQRATTDALLARMRAAVAGLERAEDEVNGLLATPSPTVTTAAVDLADRLAGLRAGLAEVRAISGPAAVPYLGPDQGLPGDLPGSVEGPRRT